MTRSQHGAAPAVVSAVFAGLFWAALASTTEASTPVVRELTAEPTLPQAPLVGEGRPLTEIFEAFDELEYRAAVLVADDAWDGSWPSDYRGHFLQRIAPDAVRIGVERCLLPSITLAQAVIESDWGRSKLAVAHNNLFGIKGKLADELGVRPIPGYARFTSWDKALEEHAELLTEHRRYAHARGLWSERGAYLRAIAPVYAEDPRYASTLEGVIGRYNLDKWDENVVAQATQAGRCD